MTTNQSTTTLSASSDSSSKREDRSAKIAVTIFPLIILEALIGGLLFPTRTAPFVKDVSCALMVIIFGTGLTLTSPDLGMIARRPWPVLVDVLTQYIVMSLTILAVTWAFRLDPALAVGVVLVGCVPSGIASNVVAYLAKGDVALSVTMTTVSTLLSPLVTPILTKYLADQCMPVDAVAVAKSIVIIVFIPIVLGLLLRSFLPKLVEAILPVLPWVSVFDISYVAIVLMGASSTRILSAGLVVLTVVIVHDGLGLALGCFATKGLEVREKVARTTAIGVGMRDSDLATTLGVTYFTPEVAVPGAVFSVWHNVSGSVLAAFFQHRPITD